MQLNSQWWQESMSKCDGWNPRDKGQIRGRGIIRDTTDKLHSSDVNILKDALTDPK